MNPLTIYSLTNIDTSNYDMENYSLERSKDDRNIVRVKKSGKDIYLGSKYSVERDVQNFMSQIQDFNVNTIFVIFGIGTGEHIQALLNIISSTNKVYVLEPDTNIIGAFYSLEYSKEIIEDKRVTLSPMDVDKINSVIGHVVEEFNINNLKVMSYANYDKIYTLEYDQFFKCVKEFLESSAINVNTSIYYSQQFFHCFVKNMKYIVNSTVLNDLKNEFAGTPAVIVSAGPSLEKNIHLLKEVKDKFLIIAGGRTIKPLNKIGLDPDFAVVIDPSEACYKLVENSLECKTPLVFCEMTNYEVVDNLKGRKIFFQEGGSLAEVSREVLGYKVDGLFQGGSVAHTSASFAKYIGCDPIIFIGQDFAYTNNKLHADIANTAKKNEYTGYTVLVEDINGEMIPTTPVLNSYRRRMEHFVKTCKDNNFINSTEGGAKMEGPLVMDLKDVISKYSYVENFDKEKFNILNEPGKIDTEFVKKQIENLLVDMKDIKKESLKAIKLADDILKYYTNESSKDISSLLKKAKKLNSKIQKINFIDSLLKPTVFRILMHPEFMEKMNETQQEKGIRLANQTKRLYEDISVAIDEAIPLIEECI